MACDGGDDGAALAGSEEGEGEDERCAGSDEFSDEIVRVEETCWAFASDGRVGSVEEDGTRDDENPNDKISTTKREESKRPTWR